MKRAPKKQSCKTKKGGRVGRPVLTSSKRQVGTYTGRVWNLRQVLLDFSAGEGKTHIIFQFCQVGVQN